MNGFERDGCASDEVDSKKTEDDVLFLSTFRGAFS